jgi:hypothetical protein
MRSRAVILAVAIVMAPPPGAGAADLVVWWNEGYYAEEDDADGLPPRAPHRELSMSFETGSDAHEFPWPSL